MEKGTVDATPDLEDVLQEDPRMMTVPVRTEGQVLTHELPCTRALMATDVVPIATWTSLLPGSLKRKVATLISLDKPFYVSTSGTGVTGMQWPALIPLVLRNAERVYVMSADAAVSATISHVSELWAD